MRFPCAISRTADGQWFVRHDSTQWGVVAAHASSRDEAIEKIRNEIRYRLELCPCSGESYQHVVVEVTEARP
jgi:hypothetical protein